LLLSSFSCSLIELRKLKKKRENKRRKNKEERSKNDGCEYLYCYFGTYTGRGIATRISNVKPTSVRERNSSYSSICFNVLLREAMPAFFLLRHKLLHNVSTNE